MVDPSRRRLERAVLRRDFVAFFHKVFVTLKGGNDFVLSWHHQHLAWNLDQVQAGEVLRLAINVPPRSGKSLLVSVAWAMFLLGHNPSLEILVISHTEKLARDFAVQRRRIAEQSWYQELFPELNFSAKRTMELVTTKGGRVVAAGVGGAVLGKGADVIILDDPMKGSAATSEAERRKFFEFYANTLIGRLNSKATGAIALVMQRLHQEDATQHLLASDDFVHISLPAIATEAARYRLSDTPGDLYHRQAGEVLDPVREPLAALEMVRRVQGARHFQAQYQQDPVPADGNIIKREWLRFYDAQPETFDRIIVSWDTASTLGETSDFSVGTVWGLKGLDFYLLDLVRGQFEFPELRRQVINLHQRWHADLTLVEETELGRALVQDLRVSRDLMPILEPVREGKEARLLAQSARFETGQVHLPNQAAYLGAYLEELLSFPNGRHDDQVDSTSQALRHLTRIGNAYVQRERPRTRPRTASLPRPLGAPQRRR